MTHLAPHPGTPETKPATDVDVLFQEAHRRRRHRRMGFAAVLVLAIGAAAAGFAAVPGHGDGRLPAPKAVPGRSAVSDLGPPPLMAWVDYQRQVHIASLGTHQQRVVSSNGGGPTTSLVVSGSSIFWVASSAMGHEVMAYDTSSGHARSFAPGTQVFRAAGSTDVFIDDGNDATIARYDLAGHLVRRVSLPDGWYLTEAEERGNAAPAIAHGGILVQSQPPFPTQTSASRRPSLAVWTPMNGNVRPLGDVSGMVATFTDDRGSNSLIAWLPWNCKTLNDNCPLQLTDPASGVTRQVTSPLGYGFDSGGAFSSDGRQLAVFIKTNPGYVDPETRLALIDVPTATLRPVPGATIFIGEWIAWAQWLPHSGQLIAGGVSGNDGHGTWNANHFLVDSATLHSTPLSFLHDGQQDVNYSAVVLP